MLVQGLAAPALFRPLAGGRDHGARPTPARAVPLVRSFAGARAPAIRRCGRSGARVCAMAGGGFDEDDNGGVDPELEIAVPFDQRPVNEFNSLKGSPVYKWASLDGAGLYGKMAILFGGVVIFLGGPIAAGTYSPGQQPVEFALSATVGGLIAVSIVSLRLYLGWQYVGNRLLSAAVEYEESGWYDGQLWVKPPEVLARDRLLGSYSVLPTLGRLKFALLAAGGSLLVTIAALTNVLGNAPEDNVYAPVPTYTGDGIVYRKTTKDGAKPAGLADLAFDDEEAAAEAAAAALTGLPGYCGDRYSKAVAGGGLCQK